jgi:hypothetical protein
MGSLNGVGPALGLAANTRQRKLEIREVTRLNHGQTNRLLGYPVEARLLITNADDFGMCHAILDYRALQGVWKEKGVQKPA